MRHSKQAFFLSVMCFLLFSSAAMYHQSDTVFMQLEKAVAASSAAADGVYEGNRAPDFTLLDRTGNKISLSDWKGKTIIVNFFASWCHPCQEEMPALVELDKRLDSEKYQVLGVNMMKQETNKEDVNQFLKHFEVAFPVVFDEHGKVMSDYKIIGIPTTFIIDEEGNIKKRVNGMVSVDMVEAMLQ